MDFDSIITVIFLIMFFILPSILKKVQARKKKTVAPKITPKTKKTNPSILGRIGDQIREFVQELERQARQQEKTAKKPDTPWDALEEDKDLYPGREMTGEDAAADTGEFPAPVSQKGITPKKTEYPAERIRSRREEPCVRKPMRHLRDRYCFKSDPLQNAVIWSEILSKPLALRNK
jgi:hypothetical protein